MQLRMSDRLVEARVTAQGPLAPVRRQATVGQNRPLTTVAQSRLSQAGKRHDGCKSITEFR